MRSELTLAAELAAAAGDLRYHADCGEAAGLIPGWDADARRTAAAILDDWSRAAGEEVTR